MSQLFRSGTKRHEIEKLCNDGLTRRQVFSTLKPKVLAQESPMIFRANVNGHRVPKPIGEQLIELNNEIGRVFARLGKGDTEYPDDFGEDFAEEIKSHMPTEDEEIKRAAEEIKDREEDAEEEKPVASKKKKIEDEKRFFFSEWQRIKKWCEERLGLGDSIDSISMRPILAAKAGIPQGIPAKALLSAMALHWPQDARQTAGIEEFDFHTLAGDVSEEEKSRLKKTPNLHDLAGYALKLAKARIPIMLVGPSGSGKSEIAFQVSEMLGLDYGETPMTAGATPSWLLGSWNMQGFATRAFLEIYSKGGVFNFEEIDAADPNMLLVANNALASDRLFNPVNGEMYRRHPDFIPVATANTYGLGANRDFTGRERLDAATIDRWRMGRIHVPIDEKLAETLLFA
jgi:AAA domain (dynein-related subfamily)